MKNKILNGSLIIMILTIGSKVIALLRDALMANTYGAELENATFIFSMRMTMLLVSIGYGLTMAIIPTYSRITSEGDKIKEQKFLSNIITVSTLGAVIISVVGYTLAGPIVRIMARDIASDIEAYKQAVLLMRIMFLSVIFVAPQSIIAGILQCNKKFLAPASMALCSNLVYLLYQLFFMKYFGIIGYGVAVVIGFIIMLLVNIPSYRKLGFGYSYFFDRDDGDLKEVLKNLTPIVISSSLVQINLFVLTSIAGNIESSSMVILDYSNKMTMMFYEVFAIAINMVTYPILASLKAKNKMEDYNKALKESLGYILIILLPVSVGLYLLRVEILSVYLLRGEFTLELVSRSADLLALLVPTIIILAIKDVLSRCFFSLNNQKEILKNSIYTVVLTFLVTYVLSLILGEMSLAIGYTLASLITTLMLYISLKREIKITLGAKFLMNSLKMIIGSFVMGLVVYGIRLGVNYYIDFNLKSNLICISISAIVGACIYGVMLYLLKVREVELFKDIISERRG